MEGAMIEEGESNREMEVAPALIAVHPLEQSVVVAAGSELRVFDLERNCSVSLASVSDGHLHTDSIRAIRFGAKGSLFVSAGDDKLVKIWTTDHWRCITSICSEKRVSAVAISQDGLFVCFADKFGVIWAVDVDKDHNQTSVNKKAAPILAHYCSIITSLEFSPDGWFIVSADRDFKIRVTVFPTKPLNGAHEIQSFCLGHTEFVSCLAFICTEAYPLGFLLSGGGDSTVRLWDFISGSLLDICDVGEAGLTESNGGEEVIDTAVSDLAASADGTLVAVVIQSLQGVMLLSCDLSSKTLSIAKVVYMDGNFIPTSLVMSSSAEHLWMVTGASNLCGSESQSLVCVRVVSVFKKKNPNSVEQEPIVLKDNELPGGEELLRTLQGNTSVAKDDKAFAAAAEAVKKAMRNLLTKKQFPTEQREFKKKSRNDKKIKKVVVGSR